MWFIVDMEECSILGYPDGGRMTFVNREDAHIKASYAQSLTGHPCPVVDANASLLRVKVTVAPWFTESKKTGQ